MFKSKLLNISTLSILTIFMQCVVSKAPCDYTETVDLTGSPKHPNGSYLYNSTLIPSELVGIFEYKLDDKTFKLIPAKAHPRGCVCELMTCITFCCPPNQKHNEIGCEPFSSDFSSLMNITSKDGLAEEKDISFMFFKVFKTVSDVYFLDPYSDPINSFSLFENGTLLLDFDKSFSNRNEFCVSPYINVESNSTYLLPMLYFKETPVETKSLLKAVSMRTSVVFMVLTIIVYLGVPKLRTLHGKSLCCYLLALSLAYTLIDIMITYTVLVNHPITCQMAGYLAYVSFMASFFWLSAISINMYQHIVKHGQSRVFHKFISFKFFCIYSFGLAGVCLALTILAQNSYLMPDYLKANFGNLYCFFDIDNWSALIYFYGPLIVIILFNTIIFVQTALYISKVKKNMKNMMDESKNVQKGITEGLPFGIFFRLFIVMGINWSLEILSYLAGKKWDFIFIVSDVCNGIQGLAIFFLFVLKKRILKEIYESYSITMKRFSRSSVITRLSGSNQSSSLPQSHQLPEIKVTGDDK